MSQENVHSNSSSAKLEIVGRRNGTDQVLELRGELDIAGTAKLEDQFARAASGDGGRTVIDLSGLAFIDSSGLRALIALHSRARENGRPIAFVRGKPAVHRVFELTRQDTELPFIG